MSRISIFFLEVDPFEFQVDVIMTPPPGITGNFPKFLAYPPGTATTFTYPWNFPVDSFNRGRLPFSFSGKPN